MSDNKQTLAEKTLQYLCEELNFLEVGDDLKRDKHLRVHLADQKLVDGQIAGAEIELNLLPDGLQESVTGQIRPLRGAFTSTDFGHYGSEEGKDIRDAG
jgi:hypothetical protein